jgi:hypothetical protein
MKFSVSRVIQLLYLSKVNKKLQKNKINLPLITLLLKKETEKQQWSMVKIRAEQTSLVMPAFTCSYGFSTRRLDPSFLERNYFVFIIFVLCFDKKKSYE